MIIEVEGQSRRLTGTAESQYEGWRKILKEINRIESGETSIPELGLPSRSNNEILN
jgi:hypothetical protein